jgi:hypothetical protein
MSFELHKYNERLAKRFMVEANTKGREIFLQLSVEIQPPFNIAMAAEDNRSLDNIIETMERVLEGLKQQRAQNNNSSGLILLK